MESSYFAVFDYNINMEYIQRLIEKKIAFRLKYTGGILISGMKDIGKTETAKKFAKSEIVFDNKNIKLLSIDDKLYLEGEKPRLIDE
jgi:hypothetical protein